MKFLIAFLTQTDENALISAFSTNEIKVVNPGYFVGDPKSIISTSVSSSPESANQTRPPRMYDFIHKDHANIKGDAVGEYMPLATFTRSIIKTKFLYGEFTSDFCGNPVIDELRNKFWRVLSRWVKKNYFQLPYREGYVAPDAMKYCAENRVHLLSSREFIISSCNGNYSVSSIMPS